MTPKIESAEKEKTDQDRYPNQNHFYCVKPRKDLLRRIHGPVHLHDEPMVNAVSELYQTNYIQA